jgi:CSLREA domain-containing protein
LLVALLAVPFSLTSDPADAGIIPNTYVVDTTSDAVLINCNAITANDCSLRGAITNANADAAADNISFNNVDFPLATPATITLLSVLPTLSAGLDTITAADRGVIIDGTGEPSAFACLTVSGDSYTIRGLQTTDCSIGIAVTATGESNTIGPDNTTYDNGTGISVLGNLNVISGNKIGTSVDGQAVNASGGNVGSGILVTGDNNTIGGNSVAARNIISGNTQNGVIINAGGIGNLVQGNYIGTDVEGDTDLGNTLAGVVVNDDTNTVGGSGAGEGNLISGNNGNGVTVGLATTSGVVILGNLIGTNSTGTADLGNSLFGISVDSATSTTIGGTTPGERNIISGNNASGVRLNAASSSSVRGNYIGTDITGALDLGNTVDGIILVASANSNTIGGTDAGAGNVISGNNSTGINLFSGSTNEVQGNFVGADAAGVADLGNSLGGILINTATNTIGGSTVAHRNIISGNNSTGVTLSGGGATGNTVAGNYIGVQADGATALANTSHGVFVSSASTNTIGGATAAAGNIIASNAADGIYVFSGIGNSIRFNSIHSNTGLGIDIGGDGVTPNDFGPPPDTDTGANNLQNFPVLTVVTSIGGQTNVQGNATGPVSTSLTFDFYHSASCNTPGGNGEGQAHFASVVTATNAAGSATINQNFAAAVAAGRSVTATATATGGHTSEFSACIEVPPLIVNDAVDPGDGVCTVANCTLREAIAAANTAAGPDIIEFAIGSGPQTIAVGSGLPTISGPITIDGTSQPGFADAPLIEINGAAVAPGFHGLSISGAGNVVKDLVINRFGANGIVLNIGSTSTVQGNYIGTNAAGTADLGNLQEGILINNSANNLIGGDTAAERNVISGNNFNGIRMFGAGSTGNVISRNIIGLAADGVTDIGNSADGVNLQDGPSGNTIGGDSAGERNIISGNDSDGVAIVNANTTDNIVSGNYIGTDITGTLDRGHPASGVRISFAPGNSIGGESIGLGNLISGNDDSGILINSAASANTVQANYVGTDVSGAVAVPNGDGISINSSSNQTIGGTTAAARNVISGNSASGIQLDSGAGSGGPNTIQGNYIGVEPDGVTALGNGDGIFVQSASSTIIGGSTDSTANIIAFNNTSGVSINSGTGNNIGRNSTHSNGLLGIDLDGDGITPNDAGDGDIGPNNLMNYPDITSAVTGGVDTVVSFFYDGPAGGDKTFAIYGNTNCDDSGHGQGETFLFSDINVTTGAHTYDIPQTFTPGLFLTMTATDQAGNTSEFSACHHLLFDADADNDGTIDVTESACGANIHNASSIPERIDGAFAGFDNDDDNLVDEPLPATAINTDCDGDGFIGLNENGAPFCANAINDDSSPGDGDASVNDGCPAVGPPELDCDDADSDADGFVNDGCPQINAISEGSLQIGTSDQDPCGQNGWPADLLSGGTSTNKLNVQDIIAFINPKRILDTSPGHPNFNSRFDLSPGKGAFAQWINIQDITALLNGTTAFPPMFANARAFDKTCPWTP